MRTAKSSIPKPDPWHFANPVAAATLAGGVLYLVVQEGYRSALRPFGVAPQEIGIDFSAAVWPATQVFAIVAALYWGIKLSPLHTIQEFLRKPAPLHLAIVGGLLYILTFAAESHFTTAVRSGDAYRPFPFGRLAILPALHAEEVQLEWKEPNASRIPLPSGRLLLLGTNGSTLIVYSPAASKTYRLPAGDIIVSTFFVRSRKLGNDGGPIEPL